MKMWEMVIYQETSKEEKQNMRWQAFANYGFAFGGVAPLATKTMPKTRKSNRNSNEICFQCFQGSREFIDPLLGSYHPCECLVRSLLVSYLHDHGFIASIPWILSILVLRLLWSQEKTIRLSWFLVPVSPSKLHTYGQKDILTYRHACTQKCIHSSY